MSEQELSPTQAVVIERMRAKAAKEWWTIHELSWTLPVSIGKWPPMAHFDPVDTITLSLLRWCGLVEKNMDRAETQYRLTVKGLALPF